jgi:hypothetical protein
MAGRLADLSAAYVALSIVHNLVPPASAAAPPLPLLLLLLLRLPPGRPHREQLGDDCKLYVGNLPQVYDKDMLRQLFSHVGNVIHSAVITEQGTGVSRGFGFVHFPDAATVGDGVCVWAPPGWGGEKPGEGGGGAAGRVLLVSRAQKAAAELLLRECSP